MVKTQLGTNIRSSKSKRILCVALSAAVAASFSSAFPAMAYAKAVISDDALDQIEATAQGTATGTSYATQEAKGVAESSNVKLPSSYDLRDPNGDGDTSDSLVTPVKNQAALGTCWGFSVIAASETSILSKAAKEGKSSKYKNLDLSELQLAYSATKNGGAPESAVGAAQAGEGYHTSSSDPNLALVDLGGEMLYGASLFASGVGPVDEELAPYKNKEGIVYCKVTPAGSTESSYQNLTEAEIALLKSSGATVQKKWWSVNYTIGGVTVYPDWSVDDDLWNTTSYEFEGSDLLPSPVSKDEDGNYTGTDTRAIEDVKNAIYNGKAVSVGFCADTSRVDEKGLSKYLDTNTWSHYTYDETAEPNHGVTIVGYDDNYSADNFNNTKGKKPEGNGAWLVKNSWGSETSEFPDYDDDWGIVDEDGKHTGYFWLSYYDRTICDLETFDFDLTEYSDNDEYVIDQYDYMAQASLATFSDTDAANSANVFTADYDMVMRSISTEVAMPNTTLTCDVYLLDDEAKNPTDEKHSKKVFTTQVTYDYGGYHRITLDNADWIAMRKGQRYAVVTTQKCNDDGLYYTCAGMNDYKPTEDMVEQYTETQQEEIEDDYYVDYCRKAYDQYLDEGMTEDEALTKARAYADAKLETDEVKAAIAKDLAADVEVYKNSYFEAKVNKGESYSNSVSCQTGNDGSWFDWSDFANDQKLKDAGQTVDNLPIKAVGELVDWASVEQLDTIEELISKAKRTIANAVISKNGAGVPRGKTWITPKVRKALISSIKTAEALMEQAGADYKSTLTNVTPTSSEAAAIIKKLTVSAHKGTATHANTVKAGKKKITVKKGRTAKVTVKKAKGTVAVISSNKKIARVSYKGGKAVIKGKKKGNAVIRVKAAGNSSYKARTVKIKVKVK